MARSLFRWDTPGDVVVTQHFEIGATDSAYGSATTVSFSASHVPCGTRSAVHAARADALEELDHHVCPEAAGG